jgi:AcrR family transcriptional regulator
MMAPEKSDDPVLPLESEAPMPALSELDKRAERGRDKRAKTRTAIVWAAVELVQKRGIDAVPTIDDFIAAAGVSRGTFYNHFETKEDLLQAASVHVSHSIDALIQPVLERIDNPAERVALASRSFIRLARVRPAWAWILINAVPVSGAGWSEQMHANALRDLQLGITQGVFRICHLQAAATLGIGGLGMALRMALLQPVGDDFAQGFVMVALQAFGVPPEECLRISQLPLPDIFADA